MSSGTACRCSIRRRSSERECGDADTASSRRRNTRSPQPVRVAACSAVKAPVMPPATTAPLPSWRGRLRSSVAALPFNCGQLYGEWEREAGKQQWTGKQQWIGMGRSPSGRRRHSSPCFCRRRIDPNTSPPARDEIRRFLRSLLPRRCSACRHRHRRMVRQFGSPTSAAPPLAPVFAAASRAYP